MHSAIMLTVASTLRHEPCQKQPIRVLLVDDSPVFLNALRTLLARDPRVEIAGFASSGSDALKALAEGSPDLVIMDLLMPGMNGLEATRLIKAMPDAPRVLILTLHGHASYQTAAAQAGADGFLTKVDVGERILPLILRLIA